jgi:hypothetical protein
MHRRKDETVKQFDKSKRRDKSKVMAEDQLLEASEKVRLGLLCNPRA